MFVYKGVMAPLESLLDQLAGIAPPADDPTGRMTY